MPRNTKLTTTPSSCLDSADYCMNSGECGINGNCICKRFFYGARCESEIAKDKRSTIKEKGISSGNLFLICAMFIVVFPLALYLVFVGFMRLCNEDESSKDCGETCGDAFFCFNKKYVCCCCDNVWAIPNKVQVKAFDNKEAKPKEAPKACDIENNN